MQLLPACPHLPASVPGLDWRVLHEFRDQHRGADFYFACLQYAQSLWQRRLAGRAILCLDRAMGSELEGDEPLVSAWPLPYEALTWILLSCPEGLFVGNPRVHFQHYADRLDGPRRDQRKWRAWACWRLTCAVNPLWPNDPKHAVIEPSDSEIQQGLLDHGFRGEDVAWVNLLHQHTRPGETVS